MQLEGKYVGGQSPFRADIAMITRLQFGLLTTHRDDRPGVMRADEKVTAFGEFESATRLAIKLQFGHVGDLTALTQ